MWHLVIFYEVSLGLHWQSAMGQTIMNSRSLIYRAETGGFLPFPFYFINPTGFQPLVDKHLAGSLSCPKGMPAASTGESCKAPQGNP